MARISHISEVLEKHRIWHQLVFLLFELKKKKVKTSMRTFHAKIFDVVPCGHTIDYDDKSEEHADTKPFPIFC